MAIKVKTLADIVHARGDRCAVRCRLLPSYFGHSFQCRDEGEDAGGQRARCAELCEHAPAQAEPPVVAQQVDKVEQRVETPASGSRGNLCLVRTTAYITSK